MHTTRIQISPQTLLAMGKHLNDSLRGCFSTAAAAGATPATYGFLLGVTPSPEDSEVNLILLSTIELIVVPVNGKQEIDNEFLESRVRLFTHKGVLTDERTQIVGCYVARGQQSNQTKNDIHDADDEIFTSLMSSPHITQEFLSSGKFSVLSFTLLCLEENEDKQGSIKPSNLSLQIKRFVSRSGKSAFEPLACKIEPYFACIAEKAVASHCYSIISSRQSVLAENQKLIASKEAARKRNKGKYRTREEIESIEQFGAITVPDVKNFLSLPNVCNKDYITKFVAREMQAMKELQNRLQKMAAWCHKAEKIDVSRWPPQYFEILRRVSYIVHQIEGGPRIEEVRSHLTQNFLLPALEFCKADKQMGESFRDFLNFLVKSSELGWLAKGILSLHNDDRSKTPKVELAESALKTAAQMLDLEIPKNMK